MQHILVTQLARFGDLVQTKRLLYTLQQQQNTVVSLCVDHSLATFAAQLYPFAHIVGIPAHATQTRTPAELYSAAKTCFAELTALKPKVVYCLNASPLSYAIARLFPHGTVKGYACEQGQPLRHPWLSLATRWTANRLSAPMNLVDMWAHLHPTPIAPAHVNPVARLGNQNTVGIVMAGRAARRSLPIPVLAECMKALFKGRNGPRMVCLGSATERPLVRQLCRLLPAAMVQKLEDRTGSTSLIDLFDILPSFDCLISPDTGTMHLAAHLGVPVQAFFLSSAWCFETGPYGLGHKVWQATAPCAPCIENKPCPNNVLCLQPFCDPTFLAHMGGGYSPSWPKGLTGYISTLDALGVTYTPVDGNNPEAEKRKNLRQLLTEYCLHEPAHEADATLAQELYQESDWILP